VKIPAFVTQWEFAGQQGSRSKLSYETSHSLPTDWNIDCNTWPGVWPAQEELMKTVTGGVVALKMYVLFTYATCLPWRLRNELQIDRTPQDGRAIS
jgi:hypothetical protein